MNTVFNNISSQTVERYGKRLRSLGEDVRTLGWGSVEQQRYRFEQILRAADLNNRSLIDIGCGFGDLKGFCDEVEIRLEKYIGWDVNSEFIRIAKTRYPGDDFKVVDLLNEGGVFPTAQIGVMLGLLNFNLEDTFDNVRYSKQMLCQAFNAVTEHLIVDFLSSHKTPDYPTEDFVYYHDPSEMLTFAFELTQNVKLIHDYLPTPQKEFMLVLSK